jgi:type VI protein secretion system component Hcp
MRRRTLRGVYIPCHVFLRGVTQKTKVAFGILPAFGKGLAINLHGGLEMKTKGVLLFVLVICVAASAQNGRSGNRSSIVVTVDGLNCSTSLGTGAFNALAWSFGATDAVSTGGTGSGGSTGKVALSTLTVSKRADTCSPRLFADVVLGRHIKTVTIVQENTRSEAFTVTLSDAIVSGYQLGGNQSSELPTEQIAFEFSKICLLDVQSGTKTCYNLATGTTF